MKKYSMIGILIVIGLMATAPAGFGHSNIHAEPAIGGSNNTIVPGDAVYIMGYYAPYNLYVTAPTNISSPMITPFELNITAAGSARATLLVNGAVVANESFSNNLIIHDNTTYTGYHNLTLVISSVNGKEAFHWALDFMSPVTYLSYQQAKEKVSKVGMDPLTVAGISSAFIMITVILFYTFLPGFRRQIKNRWIKEGPKRHV